MDDQNEEEWRPVAGFPDYQVSDRGRFASRKYGRLRLLKGWLTDDGYIKVDMRQDGTHAKPTLHSIVTAAFLGPRPLGYEVRHVNGDKLDNSLQNLAYGTKSQNTLDQVAHGVHNMARKTHCRSGHPFTASNTHTTPEGHRRCKICHAERSYESKVRRSLRAAHVSERAA